MKNIADIEIIEGVPYCIGNWTLHGVDGLRQRLERVPWPPGNFHINGSRISAFDTTGALLLMDIVAELRSAGHKAHVGDLGTQNQELLALVIERRQLAKAVEPVKEPGSMAKLGQATWTKGVIAAEFLEFLGEASVALLRAVMYPHHIRWRALLAIIQSAGVNALPIIGLLCFLIGLVIAYQGGNLLRTYGANIFIVELVSIAMVRELAPLMAAIIVAGRTGSAFTAQIGTMKVTEEIDALRTIGIDPFDVLVLPKLLGLIVALPLLTLFADTLSILGGMVVAALLLDVTFAEFINRIPKVVSLISFGYGIGKTPVFAAVIALVGCFQGFQVSGGADSVGRQTTQSVVQSIFLVIVLNAIFAVAIGGKGLTV